MRPNGAVFITLFFAIVLIFLVMLIFLPKYHQPTTITTKSRIIFKCIDGKLYGDSYLYVGRDKNEDVSKYPKAKNELVIQDGIEISCKNKETKWKLDF